MGQVVRLPSRRKISAIVQTSPAFEVAWSAYPESGRLRSSRKMAWPEWCEIVRELIEDDLTARVKRYAAEDKGHRRECGAPAFHRWLKWGRWEHWGAPETQAAQAPAVFPDPSLRIAFHLRFRAPVARAWFDRCRLDGDTIVGPVARSEWITGPFARWAVLNGVGGYRLG